MLAVYHGGVDGQTLRSANETNGRSAGGGGWGEDRGKAVFLLKNKRKLKTACYRIISLLLLYSGACSPEANGLLRPGKNFPAFM